MLETDNLLTPKQLAKYLGIATYTLSQYRIQGCGPKYLKLGRVIRYRPSDVQEWIDETIDLQKKSAM